MSDKPVLRSDEERLAALRRTQERLTVPEGYDNLSEIMVRISHDYWTERFLAYSFTEHILEEAHIDGTGSWWSYIKSLRAIRKFNHPKLEDRIQHIHSCEKCSAALEHAKKAMEQICGTPGSQE